MKLLLILEDFIKWSKRMRHNENTSVLKSDLISVIDSMESDAIRAKTILDINAIKYEHTGKRSYSLIFNTIIATLSQLKHDIDICGVGNVQYMLNRYYIGLIKPLLDMTSEKISSESDELIKTADDELKAVIKFQWEIIVDYIFDIMCAYNDFSRKHTIDANCKCNDGLIDSFCSGYQDVIKEGKL